MPTETPARREQDASWSSQELTSERDVELDTITADRQMEIRRIALELVEGSSSSAATS